MKSIAAALAGRARALADAGATGHADLRTRIIAEAECINDPHARQLPVAMRPWH